MDRKHTPFIKSSPAMTHSLSPLSFVSDIFERHSTSTKTVNFLLPISPLTSPSSISNVAFPRPILAPSSSLSSLSFRSHLGFSLPFQRYLLLRTFDLLLSLSSYQCRISFQTSSPSPTSSCKNWTSSEWLQMSTTMHRFPSTYLTSHTCQCLFRMWLSILCPFFSTPLLIQRP